MNLSELIEQVRRIRAMCRREEETRHAMVQDMHDRILADAKIIKAAEELAEQFKIALEELQECSVDLTGEDYNCPDHNDTLAAYRAAVEERDT